MIEVPAWIIALGGATILALLVLSCTLLDVRQHLFKKYLNAEDHIRFLHEAKKELQDRLADSDAKYHRACERIWVLEDVYAYVCREYGVRLELQRQFLVAADVRLQRRSRDELHGLQDEQGDRTPAVPIRRDPDGGSESGRHAKL